MTRSGHIKLVKIVKSGLGHPRGTADSPAIATLPSLPQGDFLLLLGTVLHPPTQLRVDGWGPHGRDGHSFIITSVKSLVDIQLFSVSTLSFPIGTAIRAFANAAFGCLPPQPLCITHLLLPVPLPSQACGSAQQQSSGVLQCPRLVTVRTIYSASIASEKSSESGLKIS